MRFLVNMCNHSSLGQTSLEDVIGIFGHQLRALGHQIVWDPKNLSFLNTMKMEGMNIIVEGFTRPVIDLIANAYSQGARFIIIATEEPTPQGFNHGTQLEMVRRQEMFPQAAKFCEGIICLVPGKHVTDWYGQWAPTAWTELGWAPTLVRYTNHVPTHDFGFYGSLSTRRHKIVKRLAKRSGSVKGVRLIADFPSQIERDNAMRDAKVIVQIRKFDQMGLVSSSRCNTALCLGRPVVAEPHDLSKPWDEIVRFTDTIEQFYDTCLFVRSLWRDIHRQQMEAFRTKLSPENCVGRAFREIGLFKSEAA